MTRTNTGNIYTISQITAQEPYSSAKHSLFCIGNSSLINRHKIGLLCSVKCPGDIILKTLDLMQELRNTDTCIISGFHSPVERECLKILLKGTCGLLVCPARGLSSRIPNEFMKPITDGRLLLLSPFGENHDHSTRDISKRRNRLVMVLGNIVIIPHATPGGMTESIFEEAADSDKPVITFKSEHCCDLSAVGNKAVILTGTSTTILHNLLSVHDTNSDRPKQAEQLKKTDVHERKYRLTDIRHQYPKAYEKWTSEEDAQLIELFNAGKTTREIAEKLLRQPSAISSRLQKIESLIKKVGGNA